MDITYTTTNGRFNVRSVGLLLRGNKLLVMKDECSAYFYVPGGRVAFGEPSETAIRREIREELGIDVEVQRLLWMVESFFVEDRTQQSFHELAFYYLLGLPAEDSLGQGESFERTDSEGQRLRFWWKDIQGIQDAYFYPLFLKHRLNQLPPHVEHLVDVQRPNPLPDDGS